MVNATIILAARAARQARQGGTTGTRARPVLNLIERAQAARSGNVVAREVRQLENAYQEYY